MQIIITQGILVAITNLFNYSGKQKRGWSALRRTKFNQQFLMLVGKEFN